MTDKKTFTSILKTTFITSQLVQVLRNKSSQYKHAEWQIDKQISDKTPAGTVWKVVLKAVDTIGNYDKIIVSIKSYLVTSIGDKLIV